ncbi:MAG: T9SS C-terminal target domain-containing protein [Sphingobacteriales bacterium]|nr:MAG: T9SS C-terminal target domain-containing protein [Sphingobacteriales bacterium]
MKLIKNFSITPVPFSNELNIYCTNSFSESEVIFYDLSGRILEQFILSDEASNSIKLNNNWSGISIMEFKNKNGESHFEKVVRY